MSRLIGIAGAAGSGKDTAAAHLAETFGFHVEPFAKPLKRAFGLFLTIVALNMLRKAAGW